MATYQGSFKCSNGQRISVHFPTNAIGFLPTMTDGSDATAGSPTQFYVASDCTVFDFVTTQTAGVLKFVAAGQETQVTQETNANFGVAVVNRPFAPFRLRAGVPYMIKQVVAGAA